MSFDWGGFGEGLSVGAQRGLVIGQALGKMLRDKKFADQAQEIDSRYDSDAEQIRTKYAQVEALNNDGDVQKATDEARRGVVPIVPEGIQQVAALNDQGQWQVTAPSDKPVAEQTADYKNEHTFVPLGGDLRNVSPESVHDAVGAFEKHGEFEPKQETALPKFSKATMDDELASLERSRRAEHDRNYGWYISNDPEKYRAFQKEMALSNFNDGLQQTYLRALKGDAKALGAIIGGINQNPEMVGLAKGDQIVPDQSGNGQFMVVGADGQPKTQSMPITRDLLEQGFRAFAITKKMEFDGDIDQYIDRQLKLKADRRADRQLENEDRNYALAVDQFNYTKDHNAEVMGFEREKFDHTKEQDKIKNEREEKKTNNELIDTDLKWMKFKYDLAAAAGKAGGVGLAQDFKFTADPNDVDGTGSQLVQTKDGKNVGRVDPKRGVLIPMTEATKEQLALMTEAKSKGYHTTTVYDPVSKRLEFGWTDPATGKYSSVEHPNTWFDSSQKQGRLLTVDDIDNIAGARLYGGALAGGAGQSEAPAKSEGSKEKVEETKPQNEVPAEAPASAAPAAPQTAAVQPPVDNTHYRNGAPVSETTPANGLTDWAKNTQRAAYNDTSMYTPRQLALINAANKARGGEPLRPMDSYPYKEDTPSAMARRHSREGDKRAQEAALQLKAAKEAKVTQATALPQEKKFEGTPVDVSQPAPAPKQEKKPEATPAKVEAPKQTAAIQRKEKKFEGTPVDVSQPAPAKRQEKKFEGTPVSVEKPKAPQKKAEKPAPKQEKKPGKWTPKHPEPKPIKMPNYRNKPGTPTKVTEPLPVNQVSLISKPGDPIAKNKNKAGGTHSGYTFETNPGQAITATKTGKIIFVGEGMGYGPHIIVQAQDGTQQVYAHLETAAKEGDWIRAGKRFAVADNNAGMYDKKNIFFYRNISVAERRAKDAANRRYHDSGQMKKEMDAGLFDGKVLMR